MGEDQHQAVAEYFDRKIVAAHSTRSLSIRSGVDASHAVRYLTEMKGELLILLGARIEDYPLVLSIEDYSIVLK